MDQHEDEYASDDMEDESLVDGVDSRKFKRCVKLTEEVLRLWARLAKPLMINMRNIGRKPNPIQISRLIQLIVVPKV